MLGYSSCFCCPLLTFFETYVFKKIRNTISVSISLDPDQDGHNVGPDIGPNSLQMISKGDKSRHK